MSSHVSSWHPLDGVLTTNGARVPRLDHSVGTDDAPVFFLLIWRVHHLSAGGRCNDAPPKFRSQGPGCILISSLLPTTGPMVAASWSSTALSSRPQDWRAEAGEEGTDYADPLFLTEPEPGWAQRETSSRHWSPFHFRVSCCPSRTLRRSYSYSFCLIGFFSLCEHHPWVAAWRGAGPIWALSFQPPLGAFHQTCKAPRRVLRGYRSECTKPLPSPPGSPGSQQRKWCVHKFWQPRVERHVVTAVRERSEPLGLSSSLGACPAIFAFLPGNFILPSRLRTEKLKGIGSLKYSCISEGLICFMLSLHSVKLPL